MLSGKSILVGVSGSIAAYKVPDLIRRLRDEGAAVRVVMTANAARFVTALTFEAVSGNPVLCDEFEAGAAGPMGHITITDGLDGALIAPATANIIGKAAAGIADDALSTAVMALSCPLVIAPAMNERMYRNPALQRNIRYLRDAGVRIVEPEEGPLACGASGPGRLAATERIIQVLRDVLAVPQTLAGQKILVTAGPTREPVDAVRFLSNPSTGRMGFSIAATARDRGAEVTLVTGPTQIRPPAGIRVIAVTTAAEMRTAVLDQAEHVSVVIMAAAVSDFRPVARAAGKIKKNEAPAAIQLERTDDILAELGSRKGDRLLVGFAAESENLVENAGRKLKNKNLDLIIANNITVEGAGFGSATNRVTMIDRSGAVSDLPLMTKEEVALRIIDKVLELKAKQGL
jgi:phosphopantothenoylcysteine decarboxylase/phosphopantothenate--cysteine ligase